MCDTGTRRFISGVVEGEQPGTRGASSLRGQAGSPLFAVAPSLLCLPATGAHLIKNLS